MPSITLTAKRQATFPAETCKDLGLKIGDTLQLDPMVIEGEQVWLLRPRPVRARAWAGSLAKYGTTKSDHSMDAIRQSIVVGRKSRDRK